MSERNIKTGPIFDRTFSRLGEVLKPVEFPRSPEEYQVIDLGNGNLPLADKIVRQTESEYAPDYDRLSFASPGMTYTAETDTALLEEWIPNPSGQRFLDIGCGTGRIALPLSEYGRVYAIETARPYFDPLIEKAALGAIVPANLRLGVGDIQSMPFKVLQDFLEGQSVDVALLWFGPLALMTTDPQAVLDKCAKSLTLGGSLVLTTNSLDSLSYRIPEAALKIGRNPELPLGYEPSIRTRRSFSDPDSNLPDGMILANDLVLPARFYDPGELRRMVEKTGLQVMETRGITRLTGLYPAKPSKENIELFIGIVSKIEPEAGERMQRFSDPESIWKIAVEFDDRFCQDTDKLSQYNYPAIRAVKG